MRLEYTHRFNFRPVGDQHLPLVEVLIGPGGQDVCPQLCLVDSGSHHTMLPAVLLEDWGVRFGDLPVSDGHTFGVAYERRGPLDVVVRFADDLVCTAQALFVPNLDKQPFAVLGRDVMADGLDIALRVRLSEIYLGLSR